MRARARKSGSPVSQEPEGVELDGMAGVVDRQDRARAGRDRGFHPSGIDVERVRLDVGEHGACADVLDHVGRRGEGHRRGDHLVARPDLQRDERGVERGGARAERERARRLQVRGELRFEATGLGAGGDPARAQRVHDLGDLLLADERRGEGQKLRSSREWRAGSHQSTPTLGDGMGSAMRGGQCRWRARRGGTALRGAVTS